MQNRKPADGKPAVSTAKDTSKTILVSQADIDELSGEVELGHVKMSDCQLTIGLRKNSAGVLENTFTYQGNDGVSHTLARTPTNPLDTTAGEQTVEKVADRYKNDPELVKICGGSTISP